MLGGLLLFIPLMIVYTIFASAYTAALHSEVTGGGAEALSFMLNGVLDFGEDDGLQGFIGAGAGVGRVKVDVADGQRAACEALLKPMAKKAEKSA